MTQTFLGVGGYVVSKAGMAAMVVAVVKQAAIRVVLMNSLSLSVNQQACANYS